MKKYLKQLHWQIFVSIIIGLIIGSFIDTNSTLYSISITLGVIFIKLLKMITIPLIFTSILTGITSITDFNQLGRIGFKTISYYMLTSLFAIIIGLGLTNILKPGNSYAHSETTKVYDYSNLVLDDTIYENMFNTCTNRL